jgi:hypothetical protein
MLRRLGRDAEADNLFARHPLKPMRNVFELDEIAEAFDSVTNLSTTRALAAESAPSVYLRPSREATVPSREFRADAHAHRRSHSSCANDKRLVEMRGSSPQPASVLNEPTLGAGGREFESPHPDHPRAGPSAPVQLTHERRDVRRVAFMGCRSDGLLALRPRRQSPHANCRLRSFRAALSPRWARR